MQQALVSSKMNEGVLQDDVPATPRPRRKLGSSRQSRTPKPAKRSFSFSSTRGEGALAKALTTPLRTKSSLGLRRQRSNVASSSMSLASQDHFSGLLLSSSDDPHPENANDIEAPAKQPLEPATPRRSRRKSAASRTPKPTRRSFSFSSTRDKSDDTLPKTPPRSQATLGLMKRSIMTDSSLKRPNTTATAPASNASLDITLNILQAEDLCACNTNMFGKLTSSDPYVVASMITAQDDGEDELIEIGTTKHIPANLNPKWNANLTKLIPPEAFNKTDGQYTLQLKLMDYDFLGDDTCMGMVHIPLTVGAVSKTSEWYEIPKDSAADITASGRIQVAIETKLQYTMDSFLSNQSAGRRGSQTEPTETQKDEESPTTSTVPCTPTTAKRTSTKFFGGTKGTSMTTAASTMAGMSAALFGMASKKEEAVPEPELQQQDKEKEQYVGICEEEEVLCLMLTVHQGDGLVAKDRNAIGRFNSSDPYVMVEVWPKGVPRDEENYDESMYPKHVFGRSPTIQKNLSPNWQASFDPFNVPMDQLDMEEAMLRCRLMDDDFGLGEDDPMGNVDVHLQPNTLLDIQEKWYLVSKSSATRASGRVQLSLLTLPAKQKKVVGQKKVEINHDRKQSLDISLSRSTAHTASQEDQIGTSNRFSFVEGDATTLGSALLAADKERRSKGRKSRPRRSISTPDIGALRTGNHLRNIKEGGTPDQGNEGRSRSGEEKKSRRKSSKQETGKSAIRRSRSSLEEGKERKDTVSRQRSHSVSLARKTSTDSEMEGSRRVGHRKNSKGDLAKKRMSTSGRTRTVRKKEIDSAHSRSSRETTTTASTSSHQTAEGTVKKNRVSRTGRLPATPTNTKQRLSRSGSMDGSPRLPATPTTPKQRLSRSMDGSSRRHRPRPGSEKRSMATRVSALDASSRRRTSLKALDASVVSNSSRRMGSSVVSSATSRRRALMDASVVSAPIQRMDASIVSTTSRRSSATSYRGEGERRKGRKSSVMRSASTSRSRTPRRSRSSSITNEASRTTTDKPPELEPMPAAGFLHICYGGETIAIPSK